MEHTDYTTLVLSLWVPHAAQTRPPTPMAAEGTSMDAAAGSTAGAGEATGTPAFGSYTLETLPLTNLALKALPIDPEKRNTVRGSVAGACFSLVEPDSLKNPRLVSASADALALLGIGPGEQDREDFALFMSGNKAIPGARPAAHCYCGHQVRRRLPRSRVVQPDNPHVAVRLFFRTAWGRRNHVSGRHAKR